MKNETKHTPGPWKVGYKADSAFDGPIEKPVRNHHTVWQAIESCNGKRIATTGIYVQGQNKPVQRISAEEFEANARLIAAAPELLTAVNHALNFIANIEGLLQDHDAWGDTEQDILEAVQAAIAKAEGR